MQKAEIVHLQKEVTSGALLGTEKILCDLGMPSVKASPAVILDRGSVVNISHLEPSWKGMGCGRESRDT